MALIQKTQTGWYVEAVVNVKRQVSRVKDRRGTTVYEYGKVLVLVPKEWIGRKVKVIVVPME